ncbi:hypothetical protein [Streptosporangium roseum]|uniref:hypothetical protein n=1 Tax=Streptosporangium roseum TaxID=2001 RepID=UPI00331BA9A7
MTRMLQERAIRFGIGSGLFAQADHDPARSWERVTSRSSRCGEPSAGKRCLPKSSQVIRQALDRGGNAHHSIRLLPDVRHNLNRTFDGGFDRPDSLPAGADGPPRTLNSRT